ncbi:PQQ-binding-like beta-propeller repeat protein [Planctomycetota bacterium]
MSKKARSRWPVLAFLVAVLAYPWPAIAESQSTDAENEKALAAASTMVQFSRAPGGICAVLGSPDAELALALSKQGSFLVHCLSADPTLRDAMRAAIRSRGMYGTVSAGTLDAARLPYTENLVNLMVVDSYPALAKDGLSPAEVIRALAPLGCAYIGVSSAGAESPAWVETLTAQLRSLGVEDVSVVKNAGTWVCARKPWPADIDEWTHFLHGPDGNPVAQDRVVGPPKHYQWISGPTWLRSHETTSSVSTLVTARGRLYYIIDEAPTSLPGQHALPDKWSLVARDAFNGVPLWKVPIRRWGWREWKNTWFSNRPGDFPFNLQKRLVAVGDKVYVTLGYQAPVCQLDAASGEVLQTYPGTQQTGEILHSDGALILSVLEKRKSGQNSFSPAVKVVAVDAASGKQIWTTDAGYRGSTVDYVKWTSRYASMEPPKLDPSLNTATDGQVVALIDGPDVVCLDSRTGKEKWRSSFPLDDADRTAGGIQSQGNLWIGTMIVSHGVVLHASPNQLAAFSADSGELLWSQAKKYIGHLWYEWKDVFVIGDLVWTWSAELDEAFFEIGRERKQRELWPRTVNGYDLATGELKKQVPLGTIFKTYHHHRCYRNKATLRYILASRRGTEFVDLERGEHTVHNWVRGTCHVGMMPANGLQYAPPHPCACYIEEKLSGMNALAPARDERRGARGEDSKSPRLQHGPAFQNIHHSAFIIHPSDSWPAFRHDSMRTGAVDTEVPDGLAPLWRVKLAGKVSPPIVVGDRLFVSLVDEHHVACLDVRDGGKLWEFAAGSRVNSPPTYHQGAVLFGSADGCVYCLRAADGGLAWRFRAAPEERLIGAFGQLESAWPVDGSVLVVNDTVYFAAGRSSQLDGGIRLFGLDAATGKLLHQTKLEGPDYKVGDFEENYKLPMGSLPDVLMSDGSEIYMRSRVFDTELNPKHGNAELQTKSGFLEDSYFKRTPWTFGGEYARLIVHDERSVYYVRMFDSLRGLDPTVFFTPAAKGYLLFAKNLDGNRSAWSERIPVRIRAMVLATGRLFVAGPPDVVDPNDPLGAFEGRKGGLLYVFDSDSGDKLAEHALPSPPVFNGAAAAAGRLYVAEEDGSITCLGKPGVGPPM